MNFKVGDYVTRSSYDNDIVFIITDIVNDEAILKGFDVRLIANSPLSDLNLCTDEDKRDSFLEELVNDGSILDRKDRDDFFYLPAKILHLDSDILLSNDLLNLYKIREKAKNQKYINHQKN